ncbi:MAG: hypothetical protein EON98_12585 [Chitinophagaceae bacterium]|nr:MAG: hypothetical protein EON98_12585 [Chitinophagaceae bacterium]
MREERIEAYIHQRLAELEQKKDLEEIIQKGRLSFGIDAAHYSQLPGWSQLVKQKKHMVKMVWINAFFLSLIIVGIVGNFFDKFSENWLKALLGMLFLSALIMVFYVMAFFYNIFYHFRQTEREVRKLIYQDILSQLKKEEKEFV